VIKATEGHLPVFDIKTLNEQMDDSLVQERLIASLSSLFGVLALLLAAVGLYGLMTYAINRRTGEIGIRMALGATGGQIAGMVLRETLLMVLVGVAIGVPAATASSHLIRNELYGLRANDPLTILIASLLIGRYRCFCCLSACTASIASGPNGSPANGIGGISLLRAASSVRPP